jgi:hypothetical protein
MWYSHSSRQTGSSATGNAFVLTSKVSLVLQPFFFFFNHTNFTLQRGQRVSSVMHEVSVMAGLVTIAVYVCMEGLGGYFLLSLFEDLKND